MTTRKCPNCGGEHESRICPHPKVAIEDRKKKTKPSPPEAAIALPDRSRQAKRKPDIPKEAPSAKAKIEMAAPSEIDVLESLGESPGTAVVIMVVYYC